MFVYKALHNQAPEYIKDMLIPYQSQRHLRSSQNMLLTVPRSRLRRSGDRAFSVAAPALWNVLPLSIKVLSSMDILKKELEDLSFLSNFWCLIELEYCEGCACYVILLFYVVCILVFL